MRGGTTSHNGSLAKRYDGRGTFLAYLFQGSFGFLFGADALGSAPAVIQLPSYSVNAVILFKRHHARLGDPLRINAELHHTPLHSYARLNGNGEFPFRELQPFANVVASSGGADGYQQTGRRQRSERRS